MRDTCGTGHSLQIHIIGMQIFLLLIELLELLDPRSYALGYSKEDIQPNYGRPYPQCSSRHYVENAIQKFQSLAHDCSQCEKSTQKILADNARSEKPLASKRNQSLGTRLVTLIHKSLWRNSPALKHFHGVTGSTTVNSKFRSS